LGQPRQARYKTYNDLAAYEPTLIYDTVFAEVLLGGLGFLRDAGGKNLRNNNVVVDCLGDEAPRRELNPVEVAKTYMVSVSWNHASSRFANMQETIFYSSGTHDDHMSWTPSPHLCCVSRRMFPVSRVDPKPVEIDRACRAMHFSTKNNAFGLP